jgi:hypothetical protein
MLSFRAAVTSRQLFLHQDTSLRMRLFFFARVTAGDCGHVWMLIKGYIDKLCGETPSDLRMRLPDSTTNLDGLSVTLTETQRRALYQYRQDPCKLRIDWRCSLSAPLCWASTSMIRTTLLYG